MDETHTDRIGPILVSWSLKAYLALQQAIARSSGNTLSDHNRRSEKHGAFGDVMGLEKPITRLSGADPIKPGTTRGAIAASEIAGKFQPKGLRGGYRPSA